MYALNVWFSFLPLIFVLNVLDIWAEAQPTASDNKGGMMLTPLILANNISQAQAQSSVPPFKGYPDIKSHAGYITIDASTDSNLFFWFIKAKLNSITAPILLYMSGGPGSTSLFAVFFENGPFVVTPNQTLDPRYCTFVNNYNVIYLDVPAGGGYSFTQQYVTNDAEVGLQVHQFLLQFFVMFPELVKNDFYVVGASYSGRFAVHTALTIHNNKQKDPIKMNMKGMICLSGFLDPPTMWQSADVLYCNGFLNDDQYTYWKDRTALGMLALEISNILALLIIGPMMIMATGNTDFNRFTGYESYLNSDLPKNRPAMTDFIPFVQTNETRAALHVGNNPLHSSTGFTPVKIAMGEDLPNSNAATLALVLDAGYKVLLMSGQRDLLVNPKAQREFVSNLKWKGSNAYKSAKRVVWTAPNEDEISGYVTSAFNMREVMIRDAGHMVASDQPCYVNSALDIFINDGTFSSVSPTP